MTIAAIAVADGDRWSSVMVLGAAFTISGLQLGALSPLLFAGVIFMWRLRDRPLAFGLLAGPVVACKLFLLPMLLWPLLARRRRAFCFAVVLAAGLLGAGFAVSAVGPVKYERILSVLSLHESRSGFGLAGRSMNVGLGALTAQLISIVVAASVFAASYARYRDTGEECILFSAGIVAALLASPVVWSHYLILLFGVLLVARTARAWLLVAVIASWAIAPPHVVHLDTDLIEGIASTSTWPVVAAVAFAAWGRSVNPFG